MRILVTIFALLIAAIAPVMAQNEQEAQERSRFVRFVEEQLSTPDQVIRLNGLQGVLSSDVQLASITISDRQGVWLEIINPRLQWDRSALLGGRLDITELRAERIVVLRSPDAGPQRPDMQASGFTVPELPVAVRVGELAVDRIEVAESILGFATVLSVQGGGTLAAGGFDLTLGANRLDGVRGAIDLITSFDPASRQLALDLTVAEPAGGIIATALAIEQTPSIDARIAGEGPIDDLTIDINLDADQRRVLAGAITTRPGENETQIAFDLEGQLSRLVARDIGQFLGQRNAISGAATLGNDGRLVVEDVTIDGGTFIADGKAVREANGRFSSVHLNASLQKPQGAARIPLPFGDAASVGDAQVVVRFDEAASDPLDVTVRAVDYRSTPVNIDAVGFAMNGQLTGGTSARNLAFDGRGRVAGIALEDAALTAAIGSALDLTMRGNLRPDGIMDIADLTLLARDWSAALAGQIEGTVFNGQMAVNANALSPFGKLAGLDARGTATLAAQGMFNALSGAFDLTVDGEANTDFGDNGVLQGLVGGIADLNGRVIRDTDGTRFDQLKLAAPNADLTIDGLLSPDGSSLVVEGAVAQLRALTDAAQGPATITARVEGTAPTYQVSAEIASQNGRLGEFQTRQLQLSFNGDATTTTLVGALAASGALGGEQMVVSADTSLSAQSAQLTNLSARIGGAQLEGGITRNGATGILTGNVALNANDISGLAALALQRARGAADLDIVFSRGNGDGQTIAVNGVLSNFSVAQANVSRANIDATISDALGSPGVQGRISATQINTNGVSIASLDASANGTNASSRFALTAQGVSANAVEGLNIAPANVTANGVLLDNGARLTLESLTVTNEQQISVNGAGSVDLANSNLNLRLDGQAPLALASAMLANRGTTLTGLARFDIGVGGALSAPQITGLLSVADGSVSDPLANISIENINLFAGLRADRITIENFVGRVGDGGRLSASGYVGLTGGTDANIALTIAGLPYSDGQTFTTNISADLNLSGPLMAGPLLSGTVNLGRTEITVPETFGAAVDLLDVTHIGADGQVQRTLDRIAKTTVSDDGGGSNSGLRLDLTLAAPSQIFVRGRGLDAELGGQLRITGSASEVSPSGQFTLQRGRLELLGQRIDFDSGSIVLVGDLDPFLNFVAVTETSEATAFITMAGRPSDLQVTFSSDPELPQDEVVALILFGRSISQLSPVQILRLASVVSELTGEDGLDLVGQSRALLGLDDLDIVEDSDGNVAVRAGTYINERVYLSVETGRDTETSINLDITDSLTARGSVSTRGESKIGVFFEKDY